MGSPMGINQKNTDGAVRGSFAQLGILIGRLYNLGVTESEILRAVRLSMQTAKTDGVGQEG